ncbi:MAG: DUF3169 family protein [Acutalibacteraceae bacterium]|nr:DUF3169 family protein [Acutalibacteraceae bacterium]
MKKSNSEKNKTRKSTLRFVITMIISAFVGVLLSLFKDVTVKAGIDFKEIFNNFDNCIVYALPWIFALVLVVTSSISVIYYFKSKKLFNKWDGEDEDSINKVENMISKSIIVSNIGLIMDYFLIGASIHFTESEALTISDKVVGINTFVSICIFLISLVFFIVIQRSAIELEKKINPEKSGEVLDANFQKEWENSFDEAEKAIAGKAAHKSFKATNVTCVVLCFLSIVFEVIFKIGIVPVLFVTIIWLVSTLAYQLEALKLENKK